MEDRHQEDLLAAAAVRWTRRRPQLMTITNMANPPTGSSKTSARDGASPSRTCGTTLAFQRCHYDPAGGSPAPEGGDHNGFGFIRTVVILPPGTAMATHGWGGTRENRISSPMPGGRLVAPEHGPGAGTRVTREGGRGSLLRRIGSRRQRRRISGPARFAHFGLVSCPRSWIRQRIAGSPSGR